MLSRVLTVGEQHHHLLVAIREIIRQRKQQIQLQKFGRVGSRSTKTHPRSEISRCLGNEWEKVTWCIRHLHSLKLIQTKKIPVLIRFCQQNQRRRPYVVPGRPGPACSAESHVSGQHSEGDFEQRLDAAPGGCSPSESSNSVIRLGEPADWYSDRCNQASPVTRCTDSSF